MPDLANMLIIGVLGHKIFGHVSRLPLHRHCSLSAHLLLRRLPFLPLMNQSRPLPDRFSVALFLSTLDGDGRVPSFRTSAIQRNKELEEYLAAALRHIVRRDVSIQQRNDELQEIKGRVDTQLSTIKDLENELRNKDMLPPPSPYRAA